MTASSKIQGIIFDLDGVLCDSESFIADASVEMFKRRYNTTVDKAEFKQFIGVGETKFILGVAEIYGLTPTMPDDKIYTYEIYLEMIAGNLPPLTGVSQFIPACREKNLKLAIASAADLMKVAGNLREIGFPQETFDAVVTGCDVTNNKPAPDIFLKAADKLNLPASNCLVIEDAVNGIIAGKKAGAKTLGITTSFTAEQLIAAGADFTAPNLAEVPTKLLELLS